MAALQINTQALFNKKKPIITQWASKSMSPLSVCTGRLSGEDDSMIENCSAASQMIPAVWPRTQAQSDGSKERGLFSFEDMWEVDLSHRVGPQENKGVFLSFAQGSCYESSLALGSTPIAGGLKATWGPVGAPLSGAIWGSQIA